MSSDSFPTLLGTWTRASTALFSSVLEANRAAAAAFGAPLTPTTSGDENRIAPAMDLPGWDVDIHTSDPTDLTVGDHLQFTKTVTNADVIRFATASGDTNPIHLDEEAASRSRFGGRIAHGILVTGLISAALARLPGEVIYLSQDAQFLKPVRIGDRITASIEVAEDLGGDRYRLSTQVLDESGDPVIDGEATVLVD